MNWGYFVILCVFNLLGLMAVTGIMMAVILRRDASERALNSRKMQEQEGKLRKVLDEISNITTVLYGEIEQKKMRVQDVLAEADQKILLLNNMKSAVEQHLAAVRQLREQPALDVPVARGGIREGDTVASKIYAMADQGYNVIEIAKKVRKPKGEVELILNLRTAGTRHETVKL